MWLVTTEGFISLVQDRDDPSVLQVRARVPEDISANFPGAEVFVASGADYRYRARVPRKDVAEALANAVTRLDYTSHFKDVALERSPANQARYSAYYGTWSAMARMQDYAPYSTAPRPEEPDWWEREEDQ